MYILRNVPSIILTVFRYLLKTNILLRVMNFDNIKFL
ncbi:unnamed protein product [Tenebrio molitor]|nr:unnamed protein product [Tenebrio molitor]